jgi:FixJ family two-component response regulator
LAEGLRGGGLRVEEYQTAREFLIDKVNHQRGVVVASLRLFGMSGMSGLDLVRELKGEADSFPIVLMTPHRDRRPTPSPRVLAFCN